MPSRLWPVAVCAIVAFAGCAGGPANQKVYPVSGKVLLDGKPVKGATVAFIPKDLSKFTQDERPRAVTDADGAFTLSTYNTNDGAPAGDYWVGIMSEVGEGDEGNDQVRKSKGPVIPARYMKAQDSGLAVTVKAETNALPPFELKSK